MRVVFHICALLLSMLNCYRAFRSNSPLSPFPRLFAKAIPKSSKDGKILVIVESPAKARTIQKFAPPNYIIDSCAGHIREIVSKKDYGKDNMNYLVVPELQISAADLGIDVRNRFNPIYATLDRKHDIVKRLKSTMAGCSELLLATDEDREGEAISWHLLEVLKPDIPTKRAVFNEITKDAVLHSFENPRAIDMNLVEAQQARSILDKLVGYTVTPVLWKFISRTTSAGRVQSCGLHLIAQRERKRWDFVSSKFFSVHATLRDISDPTNSYPLKAKLVALGNRKVPTEADFDSTTGELKESTTKRGSVDSTRAPVLLSKEKVTAVMRWLAHPDTEVTVKGVDRKRISRQPPRPFITSSLQQESSRRLGLSPKMTMIIAQKLYENGYITYMRTDSPNLGAAALETAKSSAVDLFGAESVNNRVLSESGNDPDESVVIVNKAPKNAQEAHEAIRPARQVEKDGRIVFCSPDSLGELDSRERGLYDLIYRRTIASTMKPSVSSSTTYTLSVTSPEPLRMNLSEGDASEDVLSNAVFKASTNELLFSGFLAIVGSAGNTVDKKDNMELIRPLEIGQKLSLFDDAIENTSGSDDVEYGKNESDTNFDFESTGENSRVIRLKDCPGLVGNEHNTNPPSRFTESSFVHELETVGVGRPSTYAYIIDKLHHMGYVIVDKKTIVPTVKGMIVSQLLAKYFPALVEPEFTAAMELSLDKIAAGTEDRVDFLTKFYLGDANSVVEDSDSSDPKPKKGKKNNVSPQILSSGDGLVAQAVRTNFTDATNVQKCRILDMPPIRHLGYLKYDSKGIVLEKATQALSIDEGNEEKQRAIASATGLHRNSRWRLPVAMEQDIRLITPDALEALLDTTLAHHQNTGECKDSNRPVFVRSGKFGRYVQVGEDCDTTKLSTPIPNWVDATSCSTAELLEFTTLPKEVCSHPEVANKSVMLCVRNGELVVHVQGYPLFVSLGDNITPSQVTPDMALTALSDVNAIFNSKRLVGQWNGTDIFIRTGKYGPYLNCNGINCSVKSDVINSITEADAIEMLTRKSAQSSPRQPSAFATSTPSQERGTKTGSTRVAGGGGNKNAVTKKSATRKLSNYQVFVQRAMKGRGLTMKEVSVEWKELSDDEKAAYAEEKPEDGDGNA